LPNNLKLVGRNCWWRYEYGYKLSASIEPTTALVSIGGFLGVLWRQVKNVFAKRDHYLAKLAQKLYFYNLANNSGALDYILDSANKEESKELLFSISIFI